MPFTNRFGKQQRSADRVAGSFRQRRGLVAGPLLLALAVGVLSGCGKSTPPAFNAHLDEYLREPQSPKEGEILKFKPKILPVDVKTRKVDAEAYFALPDEWRATTPEEVNTVWQLEWILEDSGGTYTSGAKAKRYRLQQSIIDKASNRGHKEIGGCQGPSPKYSNQSPQKPVEQAVKDLLQTVGSSR